MYQSSNTVTLVCFVSVVIVECPAIKWNSCKCHLSIRSWFLYKKKIMLLEVSDVCFLEVARNVQFIDLTGTFQLLKTFFFLPQMSPVHRRSICLSFPFFFCLFFDSRRSIFAGSVSTTVIRLNSLNYYSLVYYWLGKSFSNLSCIKWRSFLFNLQNHNLIIILNCPKQVDTYDHAFFILNINFYQLSPTTYCYLHLSYKFCLLFFAQLIDNVEVKNYMKKKP